MVAVQHRQRAAVFDALIDHLVGEGEQRRRHIDALGHGSLEIDDQLEFDSLHHCKIGRLNALEDATDIYAALAISVGETGAITHQAASRRVYAQNVNRGHHMAGRQRYELITVSLEKRIAGDGKCTDTLFDKRAECGLEVVLGLRYYDKQFSPERLRRGLSVFYFNLAIRIGRVR